MFSFEPAAKYQVVEAGEGFQTLLVVANAPFDVSVEGIVGEVNVDLTTSGYIGGRSFGSQAQSPGLEEETVTVTSPFETVVYAGDRGTAQGRGSLRAQAVQLTITYDPLANPDITVEPQG